METTNEVQIVSQDVVYLQDKAAIDVQISTAKAYPRNIKRATDNAVAIVTMDKDTAAACTYSVPRGGKAITGPSIHLAKILAQMWGNLRIEAKVVSIEQREVTSEAVCFDLENNLAVKTQVKRSIIGKTGRFSQDMITVTGNAANSIAMRNAILTCIPRGIVDRVYGAAKQVITGDISDEQKLIAKRKQVIDKLKDTYSVTEAEVLSVVGKQTIDHVTPDDLVVLIGVGTAIKDGDTTIDEAFRGKKTSAAAAITLDEIQKLFKEVEPELTKKEQDEAKRIINGNEVDSFAKLKKLFDEKRNNNGAE